MIEEAKKLLSRSEHWPAWTEDGATRRDLERLASEMNALRLIEAKRERQMFHINELVSTLTLKKRF